MAAINKKYTGKFGCVYVNDASVGQFSSWTFNEANTMGTPIPYDGAYFRQEGTRDWNGSFISQNAPPLLFPGDMFTFKGYVDSSTGYKGGTGPVYSGPAYLETLQIDFDFTNNAIVRNTYNFQGNGAWTQDNQALSNSLPFSPLMSKDVIVTIAPLSVVTGATTDDCWLNATTLSMTFSCPAATGADYCTIDRTTSDPVVWVGRQPGSILDWNASMGVNTVEQQFLPATGQMFSLSVDYKGNTPGWKINYAVRENAGSVTVDPSSNTYINQTLNMLFSGMQIGSDGTNTTGSIMFGTKQYWPSVAST